MVALARHNGEALHDPHLNGCPLSPDRKVLRLWERSPQGLNDYLDDAIASGVSFVASEWGVPDVEVLARRLRRPRGHGHPRPDQADHLQLHLRPAVRLLGVALPRGLGRPSRQDPYVQQLLHPDAGAGRLAGGCAERRDGGGGLAHPHVRRYHDRPDGAADWVSDFCQRLGWFPYDIHENRSSLATGGQFAAACRHLRHGRLDLFANTFRQHHPTRPRCAG